MNEPDVEPIDRIHRGHDGYVSFARVDRAGEWKPLRAVPARDLRQMFPTFAGELSENGYFSLQGFKGPKRGNDHIRYLTCCYADLDCHDLGISQNEALAAVLDAHDAGHIPAPSGFIRSGRGLWVLWLLRRGDTLDNEPLRAFPEKVMLWRMVQRAIGGELSAIGSDAGARDVSRMARAPGSINTKAPIGSGRVRYLFTADDRQRPFVYTLGELADLFAIEDRGHPTVRRMIDAAPLTPEQLRRKEIARKGHRSLNENRVEQLEILRSLRGGFHKGCRNHAALYLANFLRGIGTDQDDIIYHVGKLGEQCVPPLTRGEVFGAVKGSKVIRRLSNETIADVLDITPDEARQLPTWGAAQRFTGARRPVAPSRTTLRDERRKFIANYAKRTGVVPPLATLRKLFAARGIEVHIQTIADDLRALGIENPRAKKPRTPPPSPPMFPEG